MRTNYIAYTCILSALCMATFFVGNTWSPELSADASTSIKQGLEPLPDMPAGKYNVDNVHSTAMFRVQHMGAGNFWGRFNDVKGNVTFTPSDAEKTFEFAIDVPLDSVDSGNEKLDAHLKSPDFFNAKEHEIILSLDKKNKITKLKKYGLKLYDRVIKPAQVDVD